MKVPAQALILGGVCLATGSLLTVSLIHAAYDAAALFSERFKMRVEPDYFDGIVPNRIVLDQIEGPREDETAS